MFDVIIIGAGVIGVSIARALAGRRPSWKIAVLEKEADVACHTSGRNSGVVHSGFNPRSGTLKARFCVEGNRRIREFCLEKRVPYQAVGTVVVAQNSSQIQRLEEMFARGTANGVPDLKILDGERLRDIEPHVRGIAALHAPTGGIVDNKRFVQALAEEAKGSGVDFLFGRGVRGIEEHPGGYSVHTTDGKLSAQFIINAAGLYADRIAHMMNVAKDYTIIPFRGEYYRIIPERSYLVNSMVYPVPHPVHPFLGIHFTRTVNGDVIVGPNAVLALGRESYRAGQIYVGEAIRILSDARFWKLFLNGDFLSIALGQIRTSLSKRAFLREARQLLPSLEKMDLVKGRAGNRPQLVDRSGDLVEDLVIERMGNSLHILNIVSPGFTCALPFADHIAERI